MPGRLISLEDVIRAVKDLQSFENEYRTKNIDFHRRRIKNASPSQDDYDYVVRKELRDFVPGTRSLSIEEGGGVSRILWHARLILPDVPAVASDVADNRYRVDIPEGLKITLNSCRATSLVDPTTGDFEADLLVSTDSTEDAEGTFSSIFSGTNRIKILNGKHRGEITSFAIDEFLRDYELRADVLSNGSASRIEVVLEGEVTET